MSGDNHNQADHARPAGVDMRLSGEAFCADCPDHEACASGYACDFVRRVDLEARAGVSS